MEDSPDGPSQTPSFELSLSDILTHRSRVLWHEAVNVVLGVAEASSAEGSGDVPPVEAVILAPDGSLRIEPHGPSRLAPVPQLRRWLHDLLQGSPAPPPLVDLAEESESSPETLDALLEALRYFSRPNRQEELAALARRINAERNAAPTEQDVAALTARISQPKPAVAPRRHRAFPSFWHLVARLGRSRAAGLAGVGAILALAFPVVTWQSGFGHAPLPSTSPWPWDLVAQSVGPDRIEQAAKAQRPTLSFQRSTAAGSRHADGRTGPPTDVRSAELVAARTLSNDLAAAAVPMAVSAHSFAPESVAVGGGDDAMEPVPDAAPAAGPDTHLFTPDDPDVAQPVLLTSILPAPSVPGAEPAGVTIIDLVIDEHGRVDRATLVSPAVRFEERMLLSAIKAWRFRPATRNGVPVKYRARVSLTL